MEDEGHFKIEHLSKDNTVLGVCFDTGRSVLKITQNVYTCASFRKNGHF